MAGLPKSGELYAPAAGELSRAMMSDYRALLSAYGYPDEGSYEGTEVAFRFQAMEAMAMPIFYNIAVRQDSTDPRTARGADLLNLRDKLGLPALTVSAASGYAVANNLTTTARTYPQGMEGKLDSGQLVEVSFTQTIQTGELLAINAKSPGTAGNTAAGTFIKWTAPPSQIASKTTVAAPGLRGGTNPETEQELSARIARAERHRAGSGNWSHCIELAEQSDSAVQRAFVYPSLGGPASKKIVVVASQDAGNHDYSREVSALRVAAIKARVVGNLPDGGGTELQSAADELTDVVLNLGFGANSVGWENLTPWPIAADNAVEILAATSTTELVIGKDQTDGSAPVEGTRIAWWCSERLEFVSSTVLSVIDNPTSWTITLEQPLSVGGFDVAAGDWISPSSTNQADYSATVVASFGALGPGENTSDPNVLNANPSMGYRRPFQWEEYPYQLNDLQTSELQRAHQEILSCSYRYRSLSAPTVPALKQTPPNILRLQRLALYPAS